MATPNAIGISHIENTANINVRFTDGQNTGSWKSIVRKFSKPMNFEVPIPFHSNNPLYMDTRIGTNTRPT
ncbi:hypothetical protein D3C71_2247360 [compost metagenome]